MIIWHLGYYYLYSYGSCESDHSESSWFPVQARLLVVQPECILHEYICSPLCLFRFSSIVRDYSREYNIMHQQVNAINSSLCFILWVCELKWSVWQVEVVAEFAFGSGDGWWVSCIFGKKVVLTVRNCHSLNSKKGSSHFYVFIEWFKLDRTSRDLLALSNSTMECWFVLQKYSFLVSATD